MKLKKLLKEKDVRILLFSAVGYIAAIYFVHQTFDLVSSLLYIAAALGIGKVFKSKKQRKVKDYFILGALLNAGYHLAGHVFGLFTVDPLIAGIAALEQGVVTIIVAKLLEGRK